VWQRHEKFCWLDEILHTKIRLVSTYFFQDNSEIGQNTFFIVVGSHPVASIAQLAGRASAFDAKLSNRSELRCGAWLFYSALDCQGIKWTSGREGRRAERRTLFVEDKE
jgi:hypothetical protein